MGHGWSKSVTLKAQSQNSSIINCWELVRNANSQVPPQTYRIETLWVGHSNLWLNKFSRGFYCSLKLENQWCKPILTTLVPISHLGCGFMTQFWLLRPMWKAGGGVFWESVYFLDKKEERHPPDIPYNIKLQPPLCPNLYFLYSNPTLFWFHTTYGLWTYYIFVYCLSPPIKTHPREKRFCVLFTTISQCWQPCLANCDPLIDVYRMNECSFSATPSVSCFERGIDGWSYRIHLETTKPEHLRRTGGQC